MKMQRFHKRTIRRLGNLWLGFTALLVGLCLQPVVSLAQTSDSDEEQHDFRERIVKSWKWKPRRGIGLTTEEYAREYLARYFDGSGQWKGEKGSIRLPHGLAKTSFVLFQSPSVDILVYEAKGTPDGVLVVKRQTGEVLLEDIGGCPVWRRRFKFVDIDGKKPLEMEYRVTAGCASQLSTQTFQVYGLSKWAKLLEQRGVADYGGQCPKIVNQLIEPYPRRQERDSKGHLSFEFRVSYGLVMKHDEGYCAPSKPHAVLNRTCEYIAEERRFECSDEVVDAHTMTLPEIKTAGKWTDNADNIRWVLENSQELRARGFRFPRGFLERLPRHLAEGSGD
jgi:hypothetical protein